MYRSQRGDPENAPDLVIGADTVEAAAQRLVQSNECNDIEMKRSEAEAELRRAGDGYSIEALLE